MVIGQNDVKAISGQENEAAQAARALYNVDINRLEMEIHNNKVLQKKLERQQTYINVDISKELNVSVEKAREIREASQNEKVIVWVAEIEKLKIECEDYEVIIQNLYDEKKILTLEKKKAIAQANEKTKEESHE